MTRTLAAVLTALALTGCAGMAADTCQTFGYDPGTDEFLKCAQTEMTSMRADTMNFYKETMNGLTDAYANSQEEPSEQGKPSEQDKPSEQGRPGDQAQAEEQ